MEAGFTDVQYLEARKKYLRKMRKDLNWSTAEIAKKLKVMETEYVNYESGVSKDLTDYEWDDIKFFLTGHLNRLNN